MSRHDNYPDDIRMYDHDPRSPFYEDPDEWMIAASEELAEQWEKELDETFRIDVIDYDYDDVLAELAELGRDPKDPAEVWDILVTRAHEHIQAHPDDYQPEPDYEALQWD